MDACFRLQVFIRSDSVLCQDAVKYVESFVERRGGICLEIVDTHNDDEAIAHFWQLVRRFRVENPRVPLFHACDRVKVGFTNAAKSAASIENLFAVHAYIRPTCQHCRDAQRFLNELQRRWKGIRVVVHDMDREPGAVQEMTALARRHGITAPSLPIIYVCGRVISGYHTDATTGRQIEQLLLSASVLERGSDAKRRAMRQEQSQPLTLRTDRTTASLREIQSFALVSFLPDQVASDHSEALDSPASLPPIDAGEDWPEETYAAPIEAPEGIELPWFGYVRVRDLGLPAFTLLIGLIDGFNPCAMWVLVFLLSVLVNIKDRRKIAAIAGTFVAVSGLAYFAFMAAWLNLFMLVGIARPLQVSLGVLAILIGLLNVKDFFAFKRGVTLSIPESVKPGIYGRVNRIVTTNYLSVAIGLSVVLAVLVNFVELMCTAGLPALYTQILTLQQLATWKNYAYLGLYNLGYMFDDGVMVIAFVITLSHRKMREAEGRWLKLISGCVVLALGLAMVLRPEWLQW